jgi:chemotaxis response regulator CheB
VLFEPRCEVVGTVNNGRALLEMAAELQPDIIVLDIAMPKLNGLDAARTLKRSKSKAKLIFMTMKTLILSAKLFGRFRLPLEACRGLRVNRRHRKSAEGRGFKQ